MDEFLLSSTPIFLITLPFVGEFSKTRGVLSCVEVPGFKITLSVSGFLTVTGTFSPLLHVRYILNLTNDTIFSLNYNSIQLSTAQTLSQ